MKPGQQSSQPNSQASWPPKKVGKHWPPEDCLQWWATCLLRAMEAQGRGWVCPKHDVGVLGKEDNRNETGEAGERR